MSISHKIVIGTTNSAQRSIGAASWPQIRWNFCLTYKNKPTVMTWKLAKVLKWNNSAIFNARASALGQATVHHISYPTLWSWKRFLYIEIFDLGLMPIQRSYKPTPCSSPKMTKFKLLETLKHVNPTNTLKQLEPSNCSLNKAYFEFFWCHSVASG